MNGYHLSGGSIAALIVFASTRYGWNIADGEASILGAAAFSIGAGLAHLFSGPGLIPAVKRGLFGAPKPVA